MGDDEAPSPDRDSDGRREERGRGGHRGFRDRRGRDRRDDRGGGGGGRRDDRRGGGGRGGRDGPRGGRGDGPPRNERRYYGPRAGHERRPLGHGGGRGGGGERVLVLPGQEIPATGLKPGFGTYRDREDGRIYASVMGLVSPRPPFMRVIALTGRYIPQRDDLVVGVIQMVGPTYWLLDIRAPRFTPLHMTGTPWKMEYGECGEYLRPGEAVLVRVEGMDEMLRIGVTMNGPGLGKLEGGYIAEISPTKVPRVIGKSGSMIGLIQRATGAKLVVGQNGRIWIDGDEEQIRRVRDVLKLIDREGHRSGLTDRVGELLEGRHRGPGVYTPDEERYGRPEDENVEHDGSPPRPPRGEVQGPTYIEEGQEYEEESHHG